MIVCGKCPHSNVDPQKAKRAFRSSISVLAEKINSYNEWGYNPDMTQKHRLEAGRNYREKKKEQIKKRTQKNQLDQRIQQLKEKIGGEN